MHGNGTSLAASLLDALGVQMHYNPKAHIRNYLNYEDSKFVRMNARILHLGKGNWRNPPLRETILGLRDEVGKEIQALVGERSDAPIWGWKDPRAAITIPLYHSYLPDPHYVFVTRDLNKVVRSIMGRGGKAKHPPGFWKALAQEHYARIDEFLGAVDSPRFQVTFEGLVDKEHRREIVGALAKFIGLPKGRVKGAVERIKPQ